MYLVALFVNGFTGNASDLQCQNKQQTTFNIVSRTYVRGLSIVIQLEIPRVYTFNAGMPPKSKYSKKEMT